MNEEGLGVGASGGGKPHDLQYPIGRSPVERDLSAARRAELIAQLEALPSELREALEGVTTEELGSRYRPGGWTVRQVVHHVADSHVNAYVRFRLALTEQVPTIKPYAEGAWAQLPDVELVDPEVSLRLIEAVHRRLVSLLRALPDADFSREVFHPEHRRNMTVDDLIVTYAWHGRHHTAHIRNARAVDHKSVP